MPKQNTAIYHFNRGIISRLAAARQDMKRTAFSAEQMSNFVPRVLGSMMLRPGLAFLGQIASAPRLIPFVFAIDDTALIEITAGQIRFWIDDVLLSRESIATAITNGGFDSNLAGWTNNDEAGAASTWNAGGLMQLVGTGTSAAIRDQHVAVGGDQGKEHALRIVIERGPVTLRVGSTAGDDDFINEMDLATGTHSLAFVPSSDFWIRFQSRLQRMTLVDSISIEGPGAMSLPGPWAANDLRRVRSDQSADVIFVACKGYQQRRIERHARRSWSIVRYLADKGPFRTENIGPITVTPSALNGNVTLTASAPLFKATQVGALIKHRSSGQRVTAAVAVQNTFTNPVKVTGVGETRRFAWTITGTWSATVTLQRSIGTVGFWEDVATRTGNAVESDNDHLDNQIVYYRLGVKTGEYTSGTATCTIIYTLGSITGIARITGFTSNTSVSAEVLQDFGSTDASEFWAEGAWSERRGWPSALALHEGRLWWAGKNNIWGSVSDAFDDFDSDFEGDAGPISRTIGSGPVDDVNWLLPLQRLLLGAAGSEISIRSTTFDEPLSPTNFNLKDASTQGSANVPARKIDSRGVFVQRGGSRIYELAFDVQSYDYGATDLTVLVPEIGEPGVLALAVQRQPDTRMHALRSDGTVALGVIDRAENVLSWQEVETDGVVEEIAVLPGSGVEDRVYYVVQRTLGTTGLISLIVTSAGTGYTGIPTLSFSGGGGSNAVGSVSLKAVALSVSVIGTGYTAGDVVVAIGGAFRSALGINILTVDGSGGVLTASIASAGDYNGAIPSNSVFVTGGTGTGFAVNATWGLNLATVVNGGGGYSSEPIVTVDGDASVAGTVTAGVASSSLQSYYLERWALESECRGGTLNKQADSFIVSTGAQVAISSGFVSSLSVLAGSGYTNVPTLSFSGGGGAGAAATVRLKVVSFVLAGLGTGYSRGDILTLVGGTYLRPAKFQVLQVFGGGQINGGFNVAIIDPGSYTVVPAFYPGGNCAVTGGSGSGAIISPTWGLGDATITSPGAGYSSVPTVTVSTEVLALVAPINAFGLAGTVSAAITVLTRTSAGSSSSIGGLSHLEGRDVVVWADGTDLSPSDDDGVQLRYTVQGGTISLDRAVAQAVIGLPYTGRWVSTKLGLAAGDNSPLALRRRISQLALILANTHIRALRFGNSNGGEPAVFDRLPLVEAGVAMSEDTVYGGYDADLFEFPGEWATDNRLWIEAQSPRPATILAAVMAIEENLKS